MVSSAAEPPRLSVPPWRRKGRRNLRRMRDAWRHEERPMGGRSKREEEKARGLGIALSSILICFSLALSEFSSLFSLFSLR
jgi:hypothetical protein